MGEYKGIWFVLWRIIIIQEEFFLCFRVWHRLEVCILCESSCLFEIHNTGAFIERFFLLADMRNEDVAESMRQMELNFKQHMDT